MIQCPINYFQDNLIFSSDKSCWAVFKLAGYDYDFLSTDSKINVLYKVARVLASISSEAKILIIPDVQDLKQHFQILKSNINKKDVLYEAAIEQLDKTYEYLHETIKEHGSNDYETYFIVKLQSSTQFEAILRMKEMYEFFIKDPYNAINVIMNTDTKDILQTTIDRAIRLADKMFLNLNQRIRMKVVDTNEIQWIYRHIPYRGMNKTFKLYSADNKGTPWTPKSKLKKIGEEKILVPDRKDIVRLFNGRIKVKDRILTVDTDSGKKSYQTFMSITSLPDSFNYPDECEWLYMLQECNTQAEICIHIKITEHRESIKKLERKRQEFKSQIEHIEEADADIPDDLLEGKGNIDLLESEIKPAKAPMLNTSITICLAADNKRALEDKVSTVKNLYEDLTFGIERPVSDQLSLYYQFIPGTGQLVRDFVLPMTPYALAAGVIGASHQLGDGEGAYIGTTGVEEKAVFLSLGRACLLNKSASAVFLGNLGVGKSFNANVLVYLVIMYFGGYGLFIDPKGERGHWADVLPVLKGLITIVTISSSEGNKGRLDPYNIYRDDLDMANELAINLLTELFEIRSTSQEYIAILEAVKRITEGQGEPSMLKLANKLNDFDSNDKLYESAEMLARKIRLQKEAGMAKLLFGDGTEEAISIDNRLNILQIQNLKLPSPETKKENYSTEEKLSTVLMMVVSHFAKKFALVKRHTFSVIDFDESWALGKTEEGIKLYDFLTRMGRSLFTGCIFNTHSVLDIPTEGIKNTISYKFCFQTTNDNEADRMIEFLGLENSPELHTTLKSLGNGQCLFQDLEGHTGILTFDAVFQDLIDAFGTTPTTEENDTVVSALSMEEEIEYKQEKEVDIYEREVV